MSLLTTGKDLRRINELAAIMLKYGFGDVIRRLDLVVPMEAAGKLVRQSITREFLTMKPGERLRHALEEMGPTFVKLGQILATRVDRSEEHTSELQSRENLVCRLLLEKKKKRDA